MASVDIKIPQLGEGLQEARVLRFLKQPGENVSRDEPIFEMETDKAVMEIESPTAGVLGTWQAQEDDVLPIGAVIGSIEEGSVNESTETAADSSAAVAADKATRVAESVEVTASNGAQPTLTEMISDPAPVTPPQPATLDPTLALRNAQVPPRTRAYARSKGVSEDDLARLAQASDERLMPEAIDRFLEMQARPSLHSLLGNASGVVPIPAAAPSVSPSPASPDGIAYEDLPLPQRQRTLVYRLVRGTQAAVPATMEMAVGWSAVEAVRTQFKNSTLEPSRQPSQFLLFAWCVAQAARNHPRFRASLPNDSTLRQYAHLNLGIAVARPDDELLLARVDNADALDFNTFIAAAQESIARARNGVDQATESMQISLTNMAGVGVRFGIPIVAAPAVATLFIGSPYDEAYPLPGGGIGFRRLANMVITFDHRLANGIGAANFLTEIRQRVERLRIEGLMESAPLG